MSALTSVKEIVQTTGIGASEIAGVLDITPYSDPWRVFARHFKLNEPEPPTREMRWGLKAQRPIAEMFSEETGIPHEWYDTSRYHEKYAWMRASPDAMIPLASKPEAVLEIKTVGLHNAGDWGRTEGGMGDDEGVPEYYVVQVQWQMSVTGLPDAYVAAQLGTSDFRYYHVRHNPELEDILIRAGEAFWRKHLLTGEAPPPGRSEEASRYIKRRYPQERDKIRPARPAQKEGGPDEIGMLREYAMIRARLKPLEDRRKELENEIKQSIGDDEGIETPFAKFTWKFAGRRDVQWRELAENQLEGYSKDEQDALIRDYTRLAGSRRIDFRYKLRDRDEAA